MKCCLIIAGVVFAAVIVGCGKPDNQSPQGGKVLLNVSLAEKKRLIANLGFTNVLTHGPVERDSLGSKIFVRVETGEALGQAQELRTQQLIVVAADGARILPWHFPANERVTDDEKLALWQNPKDNAYQTRSGEWLPVGHHPEDVSGDWVAVVAPNRRPWIAKLDTPNVVAAELPDSHSSIQIYSSNQTLHVFARPGWQSDEGPMQYLVYDFAGGGAKPIKETTLPWARIAVEMDVDAELAVLGDNGRFWERVWLVDLKTGKRKTVSISDWTLFVKKDVAKKWVELTRP
jgi:hypothetical protein